jgi:hypothetical protein
MELLERLADVAEVNATRKVFALSAKRDWAPDHRTHFH